MARTETQIATEVIGGQCLQIIKMQAQLEAQAETIAKLKAELAAKSPTDHTDKPVTLPAS